MTIKCNFNGAIICSIIFVGGVAALFKVGIVDGMFNDIPFEEVTTEFLNYIFAKTKEERERRLNLAKIAKHVTAAIM
jgi:hypothetical protein